MNGELVGAGSSVITAFSVEGAPGTPGPGVGLPWEGSSVTQAVEAEVVVCGLPDPGLRTAVGLTQQCHLEVVGEFTEGWDGYWPLVGNALSVLVGMEALWRAPLLTRLLRPQAAQHHGHGE